MKKVLITGATGFAGSYLAQYLLSLKEFEIFGTYFFEESKINTSEIENKLNLIKVNLSNESEVFNLIEKICPHLIFHLAALTSPANSFENPAKTISNNISIQINLLEAVRKFRLFETKILIVSSADVYGKVSKNDLPMNEDTRFTPTSPYSVSKVAQDLLGWTYYLSYNLKIIRVRPFNHIGPRQSPNFVVSSFAKQIAEIEKGKRKNNLRVGNLDAKRDFTNVKDMVKAYFLAINKGKIGEVYNIGTGMSYKISDILNTLVSMSTTKINIVKDKDLIRPSDTPELLCDASKFIRLTNWHPEYKLNETLRETLDYWRKII